MKWLLLISTLFLHACSNLPANIKNPPGIDIQLHQALTNNSNYLNYLNYPIRWGGTVIEVKNNADETTMQMLFYPLNYYGRPRLSQTPLGRFITVSKQFLDPAIYTKGTEITIAGSLQGVTEKKIGEKTIKMPVVSIDNYHIWPELQQNYYRGYYDYPYSYYGYRGGFYPYSYYRGGYGYYNCY
ncbi:MAG: Slp family lipoprotein [Methylococcaceae bacterium]